jgi:serine protease AprX
MKREEIEELIYGKLEQQRRFTQDFPVLPDVWIAFAEKPSSRIELLLTPYSPTSTATLSRALRDRLNKEHGALKRYREANSSRDSKALRSPRILFNDSVVFADFTFEELIRVAMPLTAWWKSNMADMAANNWTKKGVLDFVKLIEERKGAVKPKGDPRLLRKLVAIVGSIECDRHKRQYSATSGIEKRVNRPQMDAFAGLLEGLTDLHDERGLLYGISLNRPATTGIWRSRMAVKADAAARVFDVDTSGIRWAVLDVGIDATHKAFARRERRKDGEAGSIVKSDTDENGKKQFASRVVRTYDFLRIKDLLNPDTPIDATGSYAETLGKEQLESLIEDLKRNLESDRSLDWDLIEPFLRIPHVGRFYDAYKKCVADGHGTHVAGIVAANWPEASEATSIRRTLYGICPSLELFDLRVLGKDKSGDDADEFTVIAALQFVRHLNAHQDLMTIHGVNLSMAVPHDVANYACGRTPICEECERVVANGVVVVTAAGNRGFNKLASPDSGSVGDYRYISITDPGNAENVITVGATHRFMPHNYGVSYFSSRGPTGDGRTKPDLVAPGERIDSCVPGNDFETMDGTSMAAPHVSGAAALLIARHRELIGQPKRVKEILCKSATDLGREPRFQGAGMLDVLRALQLV